MQGESWNPSNVEWQQAVTEDRSRFVIALTFGRALNLSNKSSFILGSRQELTRGDPTYYLLLDFPLYQGYSNNGQDGLPFSPTTGGHSGTNFSYDDFHHGFSPTQITILTCKTPRRSFQTQKRIYTPNSYILLQPRILPQLHI